MENNRITVSGKIISFEFSHEYYGEKFYTAILESYRTSGVADYLPIIISEKLMIPNTSAYVFIYGSVRTRNEDGHLNVFVFADSVDVLDFDEENRCDTNEVELNGFICKKEKVRQTPLGRVIVDLICVVNRTYGRSDYIPSIAWNRNARYIDSMKIGTPINIFGRLQSRNYEKNGETKTAYEVSISEITEWE